MLLRVNKTSNRLASDGTAVEYLEVSCTECNIHVRSNFWGTKFSQIAQKWHVHDFIFAVDQDFCENIILVILCIL